MSRNRKLFIGGLLLATMFILIGCGSSPLLSKEVGVAKDFVEGVFSGDPDRALDKVCIGEGSVIIIIAVEADWEDHGYELLSSSEESANVLVTGRLRVTAENLQDFFVELEEELPKAGVGVQIGISQELAILNERGRWCVPEESIKSFRNYLVDLLVEELESYSP